MRVVRVDLVVVGLVPGVGLVFGCASYLVVGAWCRVGIWLWLLVFRCWRQRWR